MAIDGATIFARSVIQVEEIGRQRVKHNSPNLSMRVNSSISISFSCRSSHKGGKVSRVPSSLFSVLLFKGRDRNSVYRQGKKERTMQKYVFFNHESRNITKRKNLFDKKCQICVAETKGKQPPTMRVGKYRKSLLPCFPFSSLKAETETRFVGEVKKESTMQKLFGSRPPSNRLCSKSRI